MFDQTNVQWGRFIARHPLGHILISLVLVLLLSVHLINVQIEYDIRASFSPANSKATREEAIYKEFFNLTGSPQRGFVLFKAKDGGSLLRERELREVMDLDAEVSGQMRRRDSRTGMRGCDPLCSMNHPFHLVAHSLLSSSSSSSSANSSSLLPHPSPPLLLDYPMSVYRGLNLFLGGHFFGVQLANSTFGHNNSRIVSVKRIILWHFNRADTEEMRARLKELTLRLFDEAQTGRRLESVEFEVFGDEIANSEMIRGAIQATILMSIGLLLLLAFVTLVIFRKLRHCSSPSSSSSPPFPLLSVLFVVFVSILCPLLSSLAAFGLCTWLGYRMYTIMCVTPFLIAGVGVDDAFIMLQSWQQHLAIPCPRQRLPPVMVHVGPSITITSLTNTIAFGIGFFTPTPQMSLFCLSTSIAVFIDYLLTFTLLAPVVLLLSPSSFSSPSSSSSFHSSSSSPPDWVHRYALFLHSVRGRTVAIFVAFVLYAIGFSGVLGLKSSFEPSKAFPSDSPLSRSIHSVREVFEEFFPINVIVNSPPNISDPVQYALFNDMVAQLESLPESWGPARTLLWLRSFDHFDRRAHSFWRSLGFGRHQPFRPSYHNLAFFLDQIGHPPTIKPGPPGPHGTPNSVRAFQFTIVARHMTEWWNRAVVEEKCRAILAQFPQFNASIHDGDSAVLNMLLTVKSDLIGSVAVTIVCMALVCSLFIPDRLGVSAIALCITSICFTLVGIISWCGADLDPVTMVDVLLATGFSVDYTAHVAHQYHTKRGSSTHRIAHSLHEMCAPMLQAGISTVLCMLPLAFVPTYAIVAFAKTIFVVVSVGLLHGLFLLPVLLCALPQKRGIAVNEEEEEEEKENEREEEEGVKKKGRKEEKNRSRTEERRGAGRKLMERGEEEDGREGEGTEE